MEMNWYELLYRNISVDDNFHFDLIFLKMAAWSSGMIIAQGAKGPRIRFRVKPICIPSSCLINMEQTNNY